MTAARSHGEAVNAREAAGRPVLPLQLPVVAVEWSCHAQTTIKNGAGEVLAECGGHGRSSSDDSAIAAEIVRRVNAHDALVDALETLVGRNATIYSNEVTLPMSSHTAAVRALRAARAAIALATGSAA